MKIRDAKHVLLAAAAAAALGATGAGAETLHGEVLSVEGDTITLLSDGEVVSVVVPGGVRVEPEAGRSPRLEVGQTVTLTLDDDARGRTAPLRLRVDEEVDVDGDEIEVDD